MKIVFFGSDDFAAVSLERLIREDYDVAACVTQPDRPSGRGLKMIASPIAEIARREGIHLLQPDDLKEESFLKRLKEISADLFVVIAYGKILPEAVLQIPKVFAINVHGSLLPAYRGAAPVNWAIINGDRETGFTIMKLDRKMDAGEIIVQERMAIGDAETAAELRSRMARQSADRLIVILPKLEAGDFRLEQQDQTRVTFAPKLTKGMGRIIWSKRAVEIHNLVRGLLPWPCAFMVVGAKTIKVLKSSVLPGPGEAFPSPGTVVEVSQRGLCVATGEGLLCLETLHPESGKPVSGQAFASGQRLRPGHRLE